MGNNGSKTSKGPEYRYVAHGIQYLADGDKKKFHKTKRKQSESKQDNTNAKKQPESSLLNRVYIPGRLEKQHCRALMVSSDWTESVAKAKASTEKEDPPEWLRNADQYPFENIVMSGGGSKGYAYIGALKALEDAGILSRVKRVAGSSAGAICGGLLAVGCTPQEIADVFLGDIKWLFQDQKCACCCCIPKIFGRYGVHPGKRFHKIYGEHLQRKVGNPDITFGELYEKSGRELCVVVTNLSKMCSEYCHPKTTPDLPIRRAVRMSMSFPMVYEAVKCEINGQTSLYTDGGTLDQYPVHCFDGSSLELNHNIVSNDRFNEKTLGLYVVSESAIDYKIWQALFSKEIPYKPSYLPDTKLARQRLEQEFERCKRKNKNLTMKEFLNELRAQEQDHNAPMFHYETCDRSTVDIRSFKEYFMTTIETLLISQRRLHIKSDDAKRTIAVNCGYMGTNDYDVEPGDREFLIRQGYQQTARFLTDYLASSETTSATTTPATQSVPGTIPEESPSREVSPAHCYSNHSSNPSAVMDTNPDQSAEQINARLSKTFADWDDLPFIDSEATTGDQPVKMQHLSNSNLNGPISEKEALDCDIEPVGFEYNSMFADNHSLDRQFLIEKNSHPICVNAEVHRDNYVGCDTTGSFQETTQEDVGHSIEPDLRTSLSDCSQPVSNSDTIDSGIHIYQPEDPLQDQACSAVYKEGMHISETVESGIHLSPVKQPLLSGSSA